MGGRKKIENMKRDERLAECKRRGLPGNTRTKTADLLRTLQSKGGTPRAATGGAMSAATARARDEKHQREQKALRTGPLSAKAQKRFDAGPCVSDGPGHVYVISEPRSKKNEYKIGCAKVLDRRHKQLARNNNTKYQTDKSWDAAYHQMVEKVLQLDLGAAKLPDRMKRDGTKQDGTTEWFGADLDTIVTRGNFVMRKCRAEFG